jgi:predicted  nucleic acid-binding Zn ribbon protein
MDFNLIIIFLLGVLIGYYFGNAQFKEKVNKLLKLNTKTKLTCVCGQSLKQNQLFCPKCGIKQDNKNN